jgi:hypothetical protein
MGDGEHINHQSISVLINIKDMHLFSRGQKKLSFSISFSHYLIHCIKKPKYIRRCSMKRTTIYKEQIIL